MCGYQAALRRVFPLDPNQGPVALCVTEAGGNQPKQLVSRLGPRAGDGTLVLDGEKTFVTGAELCGAFIVVANTGAMAPGGRVRLAAVTVPAGTPGVTLRPKSMPWLCDVPHASAHFQSVVVQPTWVLPGDAVDAYLRPFRTLEDLFVYASLLSYTCSLVVRGWPTADATPAPARLFLQAALFALRGVEALAARPQGSTLAVSGALAQCAALVAQGRGVAGLGPEAPAADLALFDRDVVKLLGIARKVREDRTAQAWAAVDQPR